MNDYQEKLQEEQTEQKPKRKKKTIQERLDRALELKAKTEKYLTYRNEYRRYRKRCYT